MHSTGCSLVYFCHRTMKVVVRESMRRQDFGMQCLALPLAVLDPRVDAINHGYSPRLSVSSC